MPHWKIMTGFPWTFNPSGLTTVSFQKFIKSYPSTSFHENFCSYIFPLICSNSLYLLVCLSNFCVSGLPWDPTSLKIKEELLIFQFIQHFIAVRIEWLCVSNLHARPEMRSAQNFKFDVVSFFYFCFWCSCFSVTSKKSLLNPLSWNILLIFYSRTFIFWGIMFGSLILFQLTFVYSRRQGIKFIIFHMDVQFSQHHSFKR